MHRSCKLTCTLAVMLTMACSESKTEPPAANRDAGADAGTGMPDATVDAYPKSAKARVRFKRSDQLAAEFARALELPAATVCRDLDRFDCFETHAVSLGGVEPYGAGIYVPLENTTVTTPLAVERIALAGCAQRVGIDGQDLPNGLIFRDIELDAAEEKLTDPSSDAVESSIARLFHRFLQREPTEAEVGHIVKLYEEIEADGEQDAARSWAVAACFSVATMMEALFY